MRSTLLRYALPLALLLAGCDAKFTVLDGARLTCTPADDHCPATYHCVPETLLCAKDADQPPLSTPELVLPSDGTVRQTAVKNGDSVDIVGTTDPAATVYSATLLVVDGGVAMTLDPTRIAIDRQGNFSGNFTATGLVHSTRVALELLVEARGYRSAASKSLSSAVPVDLQNPTADTPRIVGEAPVVADAGITLDLVAGGATSMFLDGDLQSGPQVRVWVPYAQRVDARLTDGEGLKHFRASYRDEAFNVTTPDAGSVTFSPFSPIVSLTVVGPRAGLNKTSKNTTLTVTGSVNQDGCTLASAAVVGLDASGNLIADPACTAGIITVSLNGRTLSGTANTGVPCAQAVFVGVQAIVANTAGNRSIPSASVSNALRYDATPPVNSVTQVLAPDSRPGYSPSAVVNFNFNTSEPDGSPVRYALFEKGLSVPQLMMYPTGASSFGGSVTFGVGPANPRIAVIRFQDEVDNFVDVEVPVNLLLQAPPAPQRPTLRLDERSPAPYAPQAIDGGNDLFTIAWTGSAPNVDRALVLSDGGLVTPGFPDYLAVDPVTGFADAGVPWNPTEAYQVVVMDKAGNRSPPTAINTPAMSLSLPAAPVRAGNPQVFTLSSQALTGIAITVGQVDGGIRAATGASSGAGGAYSFTANGSEPEGRAQAVVRVTANDGTGFHPASSSTAAAVMTFDFHAPSLDTTRVVLAQNAPGVDGGDTIAGDAGAVSDAISNAGTILVHVLPLDGGVEFTTLTARSDGSFGPYSLGDNRERGVVLRFEDEAGNLTAPFTWTNDLTYPVIANVAVSPSIQHDGGLVTVDFDVSDDLSDLDAPPTVTVAGNAASCPSVVTLPAHYACTYVVGPADADKIQLVTLSVADAAHNRTSTTSSVVFDSTKPISTNAAPGAKTAWNGAPAITGNASDNLSGVARVEVSVRTASGSYWTGSAFSSPSVVWLTATGVNPWNLSTSAMPLSTGQSYTIQWRAVDLAGNVETPGTATFTYDPTQPAAPTTLTAVANGEARIDLSWAAVAGISSYRVYFDVQTGTPTPPGPIVAVQGSSPITVTAPTVTLSVTELPRGRYTFKVTAVDSSSRESAYSPSASAASRWWKYEATSLTRLEVLDLMGLGGGNFVGVGESGAAWVSHDSGATWKVKSTPATDNLNTLVRSGTTLLAASPTTILRSTDNGDTWSVAQSGTYAPATNGHGRHHAYANGTNAVFLGQAANSAVYTSNGGASFSAVTLAGSTTDPAGQIVGSGNNVVAFSTGAGTYSTNGGQTWAASTGLSTLTTNAPLAYMNGAAGVAIAQGQAFTTTNGGQTWQALASPPQGLNGVPSALVGTGATVSLSSYAGSVYSLSTSFDTGATWVTQTTSYSVSQSGWSDGTHTQLASSTNLWSTDGGAGWWPTPKTFMSVGGGIINPTVMAFDGTTVVGAGGTGTTRFARSTDLGQTWNGAMGEALTSSVGPPPVWTAGQHVVALTGTNATRLMVSSDDAETWTSAPLPGGMTSGYLVDGDSSTVYLVGQKAALFTNDTLLYRSIDYGYTWTQVANFGNQSIMGRFGSLKQKGTVAVLVGGQLGGASGFLAASTDSGATWTRITPTGLKPLFGLAVWNTTFYAYGDLGDLWSSSDGTTWTHLASGTTTPLALGFVNGNTVAFATSNTSVPVALVYSTTGGPPFSQKVIGTKADTPRSFFTDGTNLIVAAIGYGFSGNPYVLQGSLGNIGGAWTETAYQGSAEWCSSLTGDANELFLVTGVRPMRASGAPYTSYTSVASTHWTPGPVPGPINGQILVWDGSTGAYPTGIQLADGAAVIFDTMAGVIVYGPR